MNKEYWVGFLAFAKWPAIVIVLLLIWVLLQIFWGNLHILRELVQPDDAQRNHIHHLAQQDADRDLSPSETGE